MNSFRVKWGKDEIRLKQNFEKIVDKIPSIKKDNSTADTSALEHEIDLMVYVLSELSEVEIAIVEVKE